MAGAPAPGAGAPATAPRRQAPCPLSSAATMPAKITVLKANAMVALAATVRRISRGITVTSVVPNVVMTDRAKYT